MNKKITIGILIVLIIGLFSLFKQMNDPVVNFLDDYMSTVQTLVNNGNVKNTNSEDFKKLMNYYQNGKKVKDIQEDIILNMLKNNSIKIKSYSMIIDPDNNPNIARITIIYDDADETNFHIKFKKDNQGKYHVEQVMNLEFFYEAINNRR